MTRQWFVAHTQANGEVRAVQHLARQGFEAYLPCYLKRRRHARSTDWVPRPLFPRYLFVRLDLATARWRAINSTVGVSHLICDGLRPLPLPDGVVADIRAREDEAGYVRLREVVPFRPGQAVRIMTGAFDAVVGLLETMSEDDRVTVLLDLLGRRVRVHLPIEGIGAIA